MPKYIPRAGDFVRLTFDPQSGYEQKGRHPALVVSNTLFNARTQLAMVCPITNTFRNVPFHIKVPSDSSLTGYIMVEQIKSVDYVSRQVQFLEKASDSVFNEVLSVLDSCLAPFH